MSLIRNHKTKLTGALLVAIGAFQANSEAFRTLVSPKGFAWITVGLGVLVALLGFINQQVAQDEDKD